MAPPRKSVSRGTGELESDPERANKTQARATGSRPADDGDPERANKTQARAQNPAGDEGGDPEVNNSTQARAPNPTFKRPVRKPPADPERNNATQARVKRPEVGGEDEDYKTGRSYGAMDDEAIAGELSLEGDGLEALEPEFATRTKALAELPELDDDASVAAQPDEDEADDANATRAGSPVKLEIIAGPDKGKTKKFKGVRMVIGRTPGVDLQLSDQSVSRRHIELVQDEGVLSMRDLGSGNGTKVNGVKVAEKRLEHGDEIHIGKTKLRIFDEVSAFKKARELAEKKEAEAKARAEVEAKEAAEAEAKAAAAAEAEAAKAAEEPATEAEAGEGEEKSARPARDRSKPVRTSRDEPQGAMAKWQAMPLKMRVAIISLAAAVFLILVVGLLLRPGAPPPVDTAKVSADQKMQDARTAVRNGDFELAVSLIEQAEKLVPGIDKTKLGNQAREELAFTQAVDEAKAATIAKRFEDAHNALNRAVKGSVKSEEAKAKVRQDLEAAEIQYKKEKIDEFIASGEIEAAKATLNSLPLDQQAESSTRILEFERQLDEQKKQDEADSRRNAANAAANRKAAREEEIASAFVVVERKFAGGEWERAASECNRVIDAYSNDRDIKDRARSLMNDIPGFGRAYDEGMKKYRQGALAQAARPLRQAFGLLGRIKLTGNRFGQELEAKLGESSMAAGREALLHDDLLTAYQSFKDATRFDPNDPKARDGLVQVEAKAEDLFQLAYSMKDSDPQAALRKFKIVVQVTDAQSTYHERAKNNIAAMQP